MKRREDFFLVDIIEASEAIAEFVSGCDLQHFLDSRFVRSAVVWQLVIIGEAGCKLDPAIRDRFENVPWDRTGRSATASSTVISN